jgi:hypothetical protein
MSVYHDPRNPLVDEEFAETRRAQRWLLAAIPDWVMADVRPEQARVSDALGAQPRRILVERTLRELADREADNLASWLSDPAKVAGVALGGEFLREQWTGELMPAEKDVMDAFVPLVTELVEEWRSAKVSEYDEAEKLGLTRLVALLAWADELADDDYRDVRLDEPRATDRSIGVTLT